MSTPYISYYHWGSGEYQYTVCIPASLSRSGKDEEKKLKTRSEAQSLAMRLNSHLRRTGKLPERLLEGFSISETPLLPKEKISNPSSMPIFKIGSDQLEALSAFIEAIRNYPACLVINENHLS
jgi:hypothetical protein